MTWRADATQDLMYGPGASVRIARVDDKALHVVTNLTLETVSFGDIGPGPVLTGSDGTAFLQAIMDAAYDFGLRPSKAQNERHLQAHLDDMRNITKHVLKMDK